MSERMERIRSAYDFDGHGSWNETDQEFARKILKLIDNPLVIDPYMVDAYYFDFAEPAMPDEIRHSTYSDMYLIFGYGTDGKLHQKWIKRAELDRNDN